MTEPATPHFCEVELDEETDAMWLEGMKTFLARGGLASIKTREANRIELKVITPSDVY